MIIRAGETVNETRSQMRGGQGDVRFEHVLQGGALPAKCRIFSVIALDPGCSIGEHRHDGETEFYYILGGEGTVSDDGKDVVVREGDAVVTGNGHSHAVVNNGKDTLRFLAAIVLD